jgi:hypothetical protein
MKKILVLVSLSILAAACAPAPPGNSNVTTNANTANANNGTGTKSTGAVSEADIIAKEKAGWDLIKKKDWDGFAKTLAPEYIEVLDDGVHDRAQTLTAIKDFEMSDVTFDHWKMLSVNKDAVLITYTVTVKGKFKGEAIPEGPYREVSGYVNRNGEWLGIYYQETLASAGPPPPAPSPSATAAKKESPAPRESPAAKATPASTGPDAIANEKIVWDLFKSKNYDAFATLLAPEFMEAEADNVYDKAGSVKAVTGFDLSKAQLSDWKALKFDEDASLVTYTVVLPGAKPPKEYHSTVWANRDGKWLALFHQGTPSRTGAPPPPKPAPTKK